MPLIVQFESAAELTVKLEPAEEGRLLGAFQRLPTR